MITLSPDFYGRTDRSKGTFEGKKTTNAFYCSVFNDMVKPEDLDFVAEHEFYKDLIGTKILLEGRKVPVKIVGVNKFIVPAGFGSTPCVEVCYTK